MSRDKVKFFHHETGKTEEWHHSKTIRTENVCYELRVDVQGEIACHRRRPFSCIRCWFRQGFREIDKYPPWKTGSSFTWAESRFLFGIDILCVSFRPASSSRVYSQLSRVSFVYQMCRSMHLKERGIIEHSSETFRRYRRYLLFRFLGKERRGKKILAVLFEVEVLQEFF